MTMGKRLSPMLMATLCGPFLLAGATDEAPGEKLLQVIRKSDLEAAKALVRKGASVNTKDSSGTTALMHAALGAGPECVRFLLEKGADPNAKNNAEATALMWAVHDIRKVRLLLDKRADVNARSKAGRTPLLLAATYSDSGDTVKLLLDKGADPLAKDNGEATALILAAESGNLPALKMLIEKRVDVNAKAGVAYNEIQFGNLAASMRKEEMEQRRNANAGMTALLAAAGQMNIEAMKILLAAGADGNAKTAGGLMALHLVANRDDPAIIKLLLDKGADVNAKDPEGNTPLIIAAASDVLNAEIVKLLLEKGAQVNVKGLTEATALAWAKKRGDTEIVKLLRQAGASE